MLFLAFLFAQSYSTDYIATGYFNKTTQTIDIVQNQIDKEHGTCWAMYTNTIDTDGWYKYTVEGRKGADPNQMGYCAGYLEGYFAYKQIYDSYNLFLDITFGDRSNEIPSKFTDYMTKNMEYALSDTFKDEKGYQVFIQMFNGLSDGYNSHAQESESIKPIEKYLLWSYVSVGDLMDILPLLDLMKYSDPLRARCTAFIKLLPDYSDVFMSHNTWSDYRQLHSVLKRITLPIPFFNAKTVVLSTIIGLIGSIDDFYVSDSNFMVFETSLLNCNETLAQSYIKPERLNYWIRANTAMYMATSAENWVDLFIRNNSGTYNNDYYVIDINKFTPGQKPEKDLVWLIEQTPSDKVYKSDVTSNLTRKGHISSFNVPVSTEIYDLMDYASLANVDAFHAPFFNHSRYLISERELPKVHNFDDFMKIGRFNDYKHDEYSHGNPLLTIAARNDLNTSKENTDFFEGATDNKACRASEVFTRLIVYGVNSPTNSLDNDVPVFTFDFDRLKDYQHDGLPTKWNFDYIEFGYEKDNTIYGNVDRCPKNVSEHECFKVKFCGWCADTNECLPGVLNDDQPLYGLTCPGSWRTREKEGYAWVIAGVAIAISILVIAVVVGVILYVINKRKAPNQLNKATLLPSS